MTDLWHFFQGLGDGFRGALSDLNPIPILIIALVIGLIQTKPDRYALKAFGALALVILAQIFYPVINHHTANWPDLGRLSELAKLFLLYLFAFGLIGVLGSLKSSIKLGAAKSAH